MNDQTIEQEIRARGADKAPRITPADLELTIASEYYFTAEEGAAAVDFDNVQMRPPELELLTICVLVCKNGFTLVGKSACVSRENFNEEIGRKVAREDAKQQLWPLLGYTMKTLGAIFKASKGTLADELNAQGIKAVAGNGPRSAFISPIQE